MGTNDTLFMFVADKEGDLSSGTLYAAIWKQTSGFGGDAAQLDWINLGKAKDHQIKRRSNEASAFRTCSLSMAGMKMASAWAAPSSRPTKSGNVSS